MTERDYDSTGWLDCETPMGDKESRESEYKDAFERAIRIIENIKAPAKYDPGTLQEMYTQVRYEIPPGRLVRLARELCKRKIFHKLPDLSDFFNLHEGENKLPFKSTGTYDGTKRCHLECMKGLIGCQFIAGSGMREWDYGYVGDDGFMEYIERRREADVRIAYTLCDCGFSKRVHPDKTGRQRWLLAALESHGIEHEAENGVLYSLKYPGRILTLRTKELSIDGMDDKPVFVELNVQSTTGRPGHHNDFEIDSLDLYCIPMQVIETYDPPRKVCGTTRELATAQGFGYRRASKSLSSMIPSAIQELANKKKQKGPRPAEKPDPNNIPF